MNWYKKSQLMGICFYVDLDETLVKTSLYTEADIAYLRNVTLDEEDSDSDDLRLPEKRGFKLGLDDGKTQYWSKVRPGAAQFLSELKSMGKVFLCTSATSDYADKALSVLGIDGFFDGKYYREDVYHNTVQNACSRFFLIDDLPFDTGGIYQKMRFLGSNMDEEEPWSGDIEKLKEYRKKRVQYETEYPSRHIQVKPFRGDDGDGDLSRALTQIKSILESQP